MVDGLIRRQKHPQGVRRGVPGSIAATLPQTEDRRQRFCRGRAAHAQQPARSADKNLSSVLRLLSSVACLLFSVFCYAEELPDPTRPPAGIAAPVAAEAGGATENQPSGLHSVIISKTRRAAIIDGETVELGGKHGDAKLIEVNEGSVVLQGAQGRQVMTLFPDVKMTSVKIMQKEIKAKPQSPAGKAQPGKQKARPIAHKEEK